MKNIKNIPFCLMLLFLIFSSVSCDNNFLDEEPTNFLSPDNFFKSEEDFDIGVLGILSLVRDRPAYNWGYPDMLYLLGGGQRGNNGFGYSTLEVTAGDRYMNITYRNPWLGFYNAINCANNVIKGLNENGETVMTAEKTNKYLGEARWYRALCYFQLVQTWGNVPLHLEPTESLDDAIKGNTDKAEVYNSIVEDLQFAEEHLPLTNALGRPTKGAAKALLGKVYITMAGLPLDDNSKWEMAREKFLELMDPSDFSMAKSPYSYKLNENYGEMWWYTVYQSNSVFTWYRGNENTSELIFSLPYEYLASSGVQDYGSALFVNQCVGVGGWRGPSAWVRSKFNTEDFRYVRSFDIVSTTNVRTEKYPVNWYGVASGGWASQSNDMVLLRWADIVLLYAEAENHLNPGSANAIAAVNAIRARARNHYDPITGEFLNTSTEPADISGLSGEELDIFIFEERVRELNMEMQLWHDLIRSPRMEYFINEQQAMAVGGVKRVYSEKARLMPIPQTELDANPLLEQNPGY